ncbi:MAG: site-specific integrase [bacterium]
MSIKNYKDGDKILWKVRVVRKSKIKSNIKVEKTKDCIKDETTAKKTEKRLIEIATRELRDKETSDAHIKWKALVDRYSDDIAVGKGFERKVAETTIHDYIVAIKSYTSAWDNMYAKDITKADVKNVLQVAEEMGIKGQPLTKKGLERIKTAINSLYNWAIDSRLVEGVIVSPAVGIKLGKSENKKKGVLMLEEAQKLLASAKLNNHEWRHIWTFALFTGMRSGELYALTWDQVDLENNLITVSKAYNKKLRSPSNPTGMKCPKNSNWRDVPIGKELLESITALRPITGNTLYVLPRLKKWTQGYQAEVLRLYCDEIGITQINFHALRATFATHMLRNRKPLNQVMRICGWSDLKTVNEYNRVAGVDIQGATDDLFGDYGNVIVDARKKFAKAS